MSNSITVNMRANDGYSPEPCNYLAFQIGCKDGNFCSGRAFDGVLENINDLFFPYPMLSVSPRLRVRMVGVARTQWTVSYISNNGAWSYASSVPQGNWFEIPMSTDLASLEMLASCFSS